MAVNPAPVSNQETAAVQADKANAAENSAKGSVTDPKTNTNTSQNADTASVPQNSPGIGKGNPDSASPNSQSASSKQNSTNTAAGSGYSEAKDWRVRISLAPGSNYLYNAKPAGILAPLAATSGVIFPYSPTISLNYAAHYDQQDLTHSNYKPYTYKNSSVEQIGITADFTAQSVEEANYVLAVIHFFRSASKMFYGKDGASGPPAGTPPPLLYLSGYGAYQFDNHPMVLSSFQYTLPTDVDYINASITTSAAGQTSIVKLQPRIDNDQGGGDAAGSKIGDAIRSFQKYLRLNVSGLQEGAKPKAPVFASSSSFNDVTRVPTKIQIQLSFLPIISRYTISNKFSLQEYATGKLLRGSQNPASYGGGMW